MVKIILAGGGDEEQSRKVDLFYMKILARTTKKVLYIPIASESKSSFQNCLSWFTNVFSSLKGKIDMITDINILEESKLNKYDSIYIGGGNTYNLSFKIKNSNFRELLFKFIKQNKIIYGGSAGAIILGENILTTQDENHIKLKEFSGLRIIKDYSVWVHYNNTDKQKVYDYIKKHNLNVIAIPEESGLYIDGENAKALGKKSIFIFDKNGKITMYRPNENFKISQNQ